MCHSTLMLGVFHVLHNQGRGEGQANDCSDCIMFGYGVEEEGEVMMKEEAT